MTETSLTEILQNDFWQCSCQFYQLPSVKEQLLSLQDLDLIQVNRILFAFWFSEKFHQTISPELLKLASQPLSKLEKVTDSLRAERRQLEQQWHKPYSDDQQTIRSKLLDAELASEKQIQHSLVRWLCPKVSEQKQPAKDSFEKLTLKNLSLLQTNKNDYDKNKIITLIDLWLQQ